MSDVKLDIEFEFNTTLAISSVNTVDNGLLIDNHYLCVSKDTSCKLETAK